MKSLYSLLSSEHEAGRMLMSSVALAAALAVCLVITVALRLPA